MEIFLFDNLLKSPVTRSYWRGGEAMRMVDGLFTSDHLLVVGITELEEAGEVERRRV